MKRFNYRAKDSQGKEAKGEIEARDEAQAAKILRERGLVVLSLSLVTQNPVSEILERVFHRISFSDLANFTRQLSTMTHAGLPLTETLIILQNQSRPALAEVVADVRWEVESGSSLGDALGKHPEIFTPVYVALVKAGEAGGVLDEIMARMAENLEKQRDFRSKVRGAMIYPAIIISGMFIVGGIMMIFVIPKLTTLYQEFEADLPATTKLLISLSNFMVKFWWLGLIVLGGMIYAFRLFRKTPFGEKKFDEFLFRLPLLGNLRREIILTELSRTLALLLASGISTIEALHIVGEAVGSPIFEEELKLAAVQVEKGTPLNSALAKRGNIPPIVPQMIAVGEETGQVDDVLLKLSHYFEQESDHLVKGLTTAIEPLIMIFLGVGVGFLIIAIIMPIYNLTSQF